MYKLPKYYILMRKDISMLAVQCFIYQRQILLILIQYALIILCKDACKHGLEVYHIFIKHTWACHFLSICLCSLEKYGHILPGDILYISHKFETVLYFLCIVWKLLMLFRMTAMLTPSALSDSPQVQCSWHL